MQTDRGRPVRVPGADHPIVVEHSSKRIAVRAGGRTIADTRDALLLREATYPPVYYVPRKDTDMSLLERTTTETYCPYKGQASYYSIPVGGERAQDAVWSYENPHDAVPEIRDRLAFYPDRVDSIEASDD